MTLAQRVILSAGMMVFSLMGLMPPWTHVRVDDPSQRVPAGYAFVAVGAPIRPDEPDGRGDPRRRGRFRPTYQGAPLRSWRSEIDIRRLTLQWGAVSVVTGGVIWLVGSIRTERRASGRAGAGSHPR